MSDAVSLEALLERLGQLHTGKIDLCLERLQRLLKELGNPQDHLPPVVHVAGTNGKGSTLAFLRAMAEAEGLRVHVYTSPHLVRFNERLVLAGSMMEDDALITLLSHVEKVNDGKTITFFESITAAAFLAFSQTPADLVLLETGLGGRYDATNVIRAPALALITPVGLDHQAFLGESLADIAREKAGIIKPKTPVILGPQQKSALDVLYHQAQSLNAPISIWEPDYEAFFQEGHLIYQDKTRLLDLPLPALKGRFQAGNAGLAIAAALGLGLSENAIKEGLRTARWPGRLQALTVGPLAQRVRRNGGEIWLDGAHNPPGAQALATAMADLEENRPRPLVLIAALRGNKDRQGWLEPFVGLASLLVCVPLPTTRLFDGTSQTRAGPLSPCENSFQDAQALALTAQKAGIPALFAPLVETAVQGILALEKAPRLVVTGSLHLVGAVLKEAGFTDF